MVRPARVVPEHRELEVERRVRELANLPDDRAVVPANEVTPVRATERRMALGRDQASGRDLVVRALVRRKLDSGPTGHRGIRSGHRARIVLNGRVAVSLARP